MDELAFLTIEHNYFMFVPGQLMVYSDAKILRYQFKIFT